MPSLYGMMAGIMCLDMDECHNTCVCTLDTHTMHADTEWDSTPRALSQAMAYVSVRLMACATLLVIMGVDGRTWISHRCPVQFF